MLISSCCQCNCSWTISWEWLQALPRPWEESVELLSSCLRSLAERIFNPSWQDEDLLNPITSLHIKLQLAGTCLPVVCVWESSRWCQLKSLLYWTLNRCALTPPFYKTTHSHVVKKPCNATCLNPQWLAFPLLASETDYRCEAWPERGTFSNC